MSINLKKWLLGLGLNLFMAGTAAAQVGAFSPLTEPSDFQYFVQPDLSNYGSGVQPHTGWFAGVEYLTWATSAPIRTQIGVQDGARLVYNGNFGFTTQTNSLDTNFIKASMQSGTRFELGFMDDNDRGWFFSGYRLNDQVSLLNTSNVSMVFTEPSVALYDNNGGGTGLNVQVVGFAPLLSGFVDNVGTTGAAGIDIPAGNGAAQIVANQPDQIADDIDRDGRHGNYGTDTTNNHVPESGIYQPIDYGDLVPLPVLFGNMSIRNRTSNYSLEINRQWRLVSGANGGNIDLFGGARYISFNDQMAVEAIGGILHESYWDARSDNRIVGGQFGVRATRKRGRMSFTSEGRFMAGADFQTMRLQGQIGNRLNQTVLSPTAVAVANNPGAATGLNTPPVGTPSVRLNQPLNLNRTNFNTSHNTATFTPLGELRLRADYQVWDAVSVNAGYTGTYMGGIMRASNMIEYTLPALTISDRNIQSVFMHGLNLGLEINR
jgi:hypothetical protein